MRRNIQSTLSSYEVVDETSKKSAVSAVSRAAVGTMLLGPIGLLAGVTAKNKGTHTVILYFRNGLKSLADMTDKEYKLLMKIMF